MSAVFELFRVFLRLGLSRFGGPVAHLSYSRAGLSPGDAALVTTRGIVSPVGLPVGTLPFRDSLRLRPGFQAALAGLYARVGFLVL
ncbi:hypothetical protein Q0M94_04100 [Deinococcus radiomollis]|uniref:hypothetical protein n=1 Tax=Deinococcus radiomollis TaxID=468916 RepID=UPI003891B9A8